jgi:hypothetical protein
MTATVRQLLFAALAPALFYAVVATPVELLGCRTRGLLAFGIAVASGLLAVAAALRGVLLRARGAPNGRWIATALVLGVPVVALLLLA